MLNRSIRPKSSEPQGHSHTANKKPCIKFGSPGHPGSSKKIEHWEAIFSDRNGKRSCFFDGSRRKSGQLTGTLILPATFLCMLLPRFSPVSSCYPGMCPRQRPLLSCLLLFHKVWEKNCARLIVKCRNTGNGEEVYHSSTINQLDIKYAREYHLEIGTTMSIR